MEPSTSYLAELDQKIKELQELKKLENPLVAYKAGSLELSQQVKRHVSRPLGFKTLDRLLDGVSSGELIVITAPTATGKTAFAQSITWNLAQQKVASLWYSLEVSPWNFLQPFHKNDVEVRLNTDGTLHNLGSYPIYWPKALDSLDFDGLQKTIRYANVVCGVEHVFIDHLHYLLDHRDVQKQSNVSLYIGDRLRRLRQIAHETGVSIFLIAHMTKTNDEREPNLNDLRDSSFIAQEADVILVLTRKRLAEPIEQLGIDGTPYFVTHSPIAKCKIEKARRTGANGSFDLIFENKLYVDPFIDARRQHIYEDLKELYEPDRKSRPRPAKTMDRLI